MNASRDGQVIQVPALHGAAKGQGRLCSAIIQVYNTLDPIIPWPINGHAGPILDAKTWWTRLGQQVPAELGGPLQALQHLGADA